MKRWIVLLAFALLFVTAGSLPEDPRYEQPVTLKTSLQGDPLDVVLSALARAVGLTPIIKLPPELQNVKVRLAVENKPFREVWDVLIQAYGEGKLDYALIDDGILLVAPPEVVARAQGKTGATTELAAVREFVEVKYIDPEAAAKLIKQEIPELSVQRVPNQRLLILRGSPELIQEAKKLLQKIDVSAVEKEEKLSRVFVSLRYIKAEEIPKLIEFLTQEIPGIQVRQIPGQKLLVIKGTQEQLQQAMEIVSRTDVPPPPPVELIQKVYKLSYANAANLAPLLQNALQVKGINAAVIVKGKQEAERGSENTDNTQAKATTKETGALVKQEDAQVSIQADERTNSLIVLGQKHHLQLIDELVRQLDVPVAQVSVQVRIQEVTRTTLNNLGLNWEAAGGNLVAKLADAGLQLIFDATRSLAALNIGATLNALEKQGLSRRVNDSNITVLNNQTGRIQSGFTFFIRRVRDGQVEKIPYDAGVIVEVTPQVTNSDEIVLNVHTEVSDILERNPVDGDVDKLSKQVTETILRVKDGETVVIGGLIKNSTKRSKQGIPVLSDIPIVGALFSQTTRETEDNELIIVLKARRITPTECPGALESPCN